MPTIRDLFRLRSFVLLIALCGGFFLHMDSASAARKALVIGISAYENVPPLDGPVEDAEAIYGKLIDLGYNSTLLINDQVTFQNFNVSWSDFLTAIDPGDDVVVYYSGHGVEIGGTNYIVPKDVLSPIRLGSEHALARSLVSIPQLMDELNQRQAQAAIWILDACRDNPFKITGPGTTKALGSPTGLASSSAPAGTFVFYAAGYRETALPRIKTDTSKNSLYTRYFIEALKIMSSEPVNDLAVSVRQKVRAKALPHNQRPAYYDGLEGFWCFEACAPQNAVVALNTVSDTIALKGLASGKGLHPAVLSEIAALPAQQQAALQEEKTTNAVFLGRRSFSESCKEGQVSDKYPFGCEFLKKVVGGGSRSLLGESITALTEVSIRRGPPIPTAEGYSTFQCVVGILKPEMQIKLSSITEAQEGGDVYYWGSAEGQARDCDGRIIPEASSESQSPTPPSGPSAVDPVLKDLINQLTSDDTKARRAARTELGRSITQMSDEKVQELTADLDSRSYRYQLGLAVALSESKKPLSPAVQTDLTKLLEITRETTLRNIVRTLQTP